MLNIYFLILICSNGLKGTAPEKNNCQKRHICIQSNKSRARNLLNRTVLEFIVISVRCTHLYHIGFQLTESTPKISVPLILPHWPHWQNTIDTYDIHMHSLFRTFHWDNLFFLDIYVAVNSLPLLKWYDIFDRYLVPVHSVQLIQLLIECVCL